MANEKRLIDANELLKALEWECGDVCEQIEYSDYLECECGFSREAINELVQKLPTVDAYTEEQIASIVKKVKQLEISNQELETEYAWLKSCLNCKIRNKCPRHCGKVVHDCDHWEYGDSMVHGRWIAVPSSDMMTGKAYKCSECNKMRYGSFMPNYCQNCGAKMDGESTSQ